MQFSTVALATLLATASTFASPTQRSLQGHQHCHATDEAAGNAAYTVQVGVPFNSGLCRDVKIDLKGELFADGVDCSLLPNRFTEVKFTLPEGESKRINKFLEGKFPGVNGFNCPDF
jgi:hypothetical protein